MQYLATWPQKQRTQDRHFASIEMTFGKENNEFDWNMSRIMFENAQVNKNCTWCWMMMGWKTKYPSVSHPGSVRQGRGHAGWGLVVVGWPMYCWWPVLERAAGPKLTQNSTKYSNNSSPSSIHPSHTQHDREAGGWEACSNCTPHTTRCVCSEPTQMPAHAARCGDNLPTTRNVHKTKG